MCGAAVLLTACTTTVRGVASPPPTTEATATTPSTAAPTTPAIEVTPPPERGQGVVLELENPQASPQGGKKMLVLVASAAGDLWFFKLTGPSDLVEKERPRFDAFVKSLEFGGESR